MLEELNVGDLVLVHDSYGRPVLGIIVEKKENYNCRLEWSDNFFDNAFHDYFSVIGWKRQYEKWVKNNNS